MQIVFDSDSEMVDYILTREDLMESIVIRYNPSDIAKTLQVKHYGNYTLDLDDLEWGIKLKNHINEFEKVIKRIKHFIK